MRSMRTTRALWAVVMIVATAGLVAGWQGGLGAQPSTDPAIRVGATDLGGVVRSAGGPEAGVWVIAEKIGRAHV